MLKPEKILTLRQEAEKKLADFATQKGSVVHDLQNWLSKKYADEVMHELQIHQIELELQNEELRQAQILLEESRDRYFDLYEFAPIGYFTLTTDCVISTCNLTGMQLLGISDKSKLVNRRFANFITPEDLERWNVYFLRAKQQSEKQNQNIALTIKRVDNILFKARLDTRFDTQNLMRVAVVNLTE